MTNRFMFGAVLARPHLFESFMHVDSFDVLYQPWRVRLLSKVSATLERTFYTCPMLERSGSQDALFAAGGETVRTLRNAPSAGRISLKARGCNGHSPLRLAMISVSGHRNMKAAHRLVLDDAFQLGAFRECSRFQISPEFDQETACNCHNPDFTGLLSSIRKALVVPQGQS